MYNNWSTTVTVNQPSYHEYTEQKCIYIQTVSTVKNKKLNVLHSYKVVTIAIEQIGSDTTC